jgi:hypothetical protein
VKAETVFPGKQLSEYGCISYTCVDTNFADDHIVSDIGVNVLNGAVILRSEDRKKIQGCKLYGLFVKPGAMYLPLKLSL